MKFNGTKVPIDAAAAALHVTEAFIRVGMQQGKLPGLDRVSKCQIQLKRLIT